MRRGFIVLVAVGLGAFLQIPAYSGIISASNTNASDTVAGPLGGSPPISFVFDPVQFPGYSGSYAGTIFSETLGSTTPDQITFSETTALGSNDDGGSSNRLVLQITNNTGTALGSYTGILSGGASINGGAVFGGNVSGATFNSNGSQIAYSQQNGTGQGVGFSFLFTDVFAQPLANGQSAAIYIPVYVGNPAIASFTLSESVAPVPVPAVGGLLMWGLGGLGILARRRRGESVRRAAA